MKKKMETKSTNPTEQKIFDFDVKQVRDEGRISGWCNRYVVDGEEVIDRQGDIIKFGSLLVDSKSKDGKIVVPLLLQHDINRPIGKCVVYERVLGKDVGLWGEMELAIHSTNRTLKERASESFELIKQGIMTKMSIGFLTLESKYEKIRDKKSGIEKMCRLITKYQIVENSLVTVPANPYADILAVKNSDEQQRSEILSILGKEYCSYGAFQDAMVQAFIDHPEKAFMIDEYLKNACASLSASEVPHINWGLVSTDSHLKQWALEFASLLDSNYEAQSFLEDFINKLGPYSAKRRIFGAH